MAIYRSIQLSFWSDPKVSDEFTPEDKYFYLYLLTNPHTNASGCYELSTRQMSIETGYSQETIQRLIQRFAIVHDVIRYSKDNKELLIINWYKYNWTSSSKFRISILKSINSIKTQPYRDYLLKCYESFGEEDEEPPCVTEENILSEDKDIDDEIPAPKKKKKPEEQKHLFGEYNHVKLTDKQYSKLIDDYGEEAVLNGIKKVDEYCQRSGRRYQDYNLTIRNWGIESPKLQTKKDTDTGQVRRTLQ